MGSLGYVDLILLMDDFDSLIMVCEECEIRVCIEDKISSRTYSDSS